MKFLVLIPAVFLHNVLGSSVPETFESYDCTKEKQNLMLQFANNFTGCEQTWTVETIPIAKIVNGRAECHRPCSDVTPSGIVLNACVNITLTAFCTKEYIMEYRMHFIDQHKVASNCEVKRKLGKMNIPSPLQEPKGRARYGLLACLAVFFPVALGLILQRCRSSLSHGRRNAGLSEV